MKEIILSPSDLSYFWSDSKIGFYDKYVLNILRPKQSFPSVFNTIDGCMKNAFEKISCTEIVENAPEGKITHDEINVQSKPIKVGDFDVSFRGKLDCLLHISDNDYYVVDYKTTHISEKLKNIYFLQLMAYAFCLENPLNGTPKTIKGLGLIVFQPKNFSFELNQGNLSGQLEWVEIPFDKNKFKKWISEELKTLLHSDREKLFKSYLDLSWENYIKNFSIEDEEE